MSVAKYCPSEYMVEDILRKTLFRDRFENLLWKCNFLPLIDVDI